MRRDWDVAPGPAEVPLRLERLALYATCLAEAARHGESFDVERAFKVIEAEAGNLAAAAKGRAAGRPKATRGRMLAAELIGLAEGYGFQIFRNATSDAPCAVDLVAEALEDVPIPPLRVFGRSTRDSDALFRLLARGLSPEEALAGSLHRDPVAAAIWRDMPRSREALAKLARQTRVVDFDRDLATAKVAQARRFALNNARDALERWRRERIGN
jgi:hypothetical protein